MFDDQGQHVGVVTIMTGFGLGTQGAVKRRAVVVLDSMGKGFYKNAKLKKLAAESVPTILIFDADMKSSIVLPALLLVLFWRNTPRVWALFAHRW